MLRQNVVKTRGWMGVLLGEPEPSLCLFPLRLYCFAQLYTGFLWRKGHAKEKRIVVWGQSQEQTCIITAL